MDWRGFLPKIAARVKTSRFLSALFLVLLLPLSTRAGQTIAIRNASFENGVSLAKGGFTAGDIPEWEDRVAASAQSGVFNPDTPINFAANGTYVVFFNPAGQINQDLKFADNSNVTAQPGMTVTVNLQARGRMSTQESLRFNLRTTSNSNQVLTAPVSVTVPANAIGYSPVSVTMTLPSLAALGANAGQALYLFIDNPGAQQVNIDQVSASATLPPVITSFSAAPNIITTVGGSTTLSWAVTGATSLTLNGAPIAGTSTVVSPASTTTYTLAATNSDGTVQSQATVVVNAPTSLVISEFMARNVSSLADGDGQFNDWVEITNPTLAAINTAGFYLTDDRANLTKNPLPARVIPPGGRLLVFCSGKTVSNYVDAAGNPHTNFRLADEGEYLGLIAADGVTVLSEFFPIYPEQFPNISYGSGFAPNHVSEPLVASGASLKYKIPAAEIPNWQARAGFDDSTWTNGAMSIGYNLNFGPLTTAYATPANTAGTQAYGGRLGMDFVVAQPISVTELGAFDDNSNGIAAGVTITVELWSRNENGTPGVFSDDTGGSVLTTTTFTSASQGTASGGHRFKSITPVTLNPGAYTIVAYGYGSSERCGNVGTGSAAQQTNDGAGAISFVGTSRFLTGVGFPTTVDAGPAARYGAGTFRFQTVPGGAVTTNIAAAMQNVNASAYLRIPFAAVNPQFAAMTLNISYDDGFIASLNGVPIASRNAPAVAAFNATATAAATLTESIDVSQYASLLVDGTNMLAIQGLNVAANDGDFRIDARLSGESSAPAFVYFTSPTPGGANSVGQLYPRVLISEIHTDPEDEKLYPLEFIELYNPGATPVDMSGWSFSKGITFVFPPGTIIPARGYVVIAENPTVLLQRLGAVGVGPWVGSLANGGETIELVDALGNVVDKVDYGLGFPWPTVGLEIGSVNGYSMQLLNEGLDNELGGAWRAAAPTPGAANVFSVLNAPPLIRQVDHTPVTPSAVPTAVIPSGTPVTVTAKVTDSDGLWDVTLEYQIVEPGNYVRLTDAVFATNWTSIAMHDDGANGDAVAHDAVYAAQIPASVQTHRRLIRYRIRATDGFLQTVTAPLSTEPCPNFSYFVYDGVPAWTAAVNPAGTPATEFTTAEMRKVRPWHLLSQPADVQNCQYNPAYNDSEFRFEGALVVEGRVYDHIHYRVKGQNSTFNTGKNKWKVKFNRGQWLEMPDDYGLSHTTVGTLNITSGVSPWAPWNRGVAALDEVMEYRMTELAGVPSPRTSYFQLRVIDDANEAAASQYDGDFWGLYVAFENQDNRFKDAHGLPDGNLFRLQSGSTHVIGQGAGQPSDLSDLNTFTSATTGYNKGTLGNAASQQNEAWFRANVDLQKYYSWRAVVEAVNNTDLRERENVVYFRDPTDGRWHVEPWDCDLLYEQLDRWGPQATQTTTAYEGIRRCTDQPALKIEFQNRARELQDLLLNNDQAWKLIDEFISIISAESPRIIPNGGAIATGLVEADRRRWDYWPSNPVPPRGNGAFGNYYKTPYPIPNMGLGPTQPFNRVLASADFPGQVKWIKDFIASDAHGGGRLALMSTGAINPSTLAVGSASQFPNTPVITDLSPAQHPLNNLVFQTSAFSSPNGQAFSAMKWRIAECRWPGLVGHVNGKPWRYEIQETWATGEIPVFNNQITIPPQPLETGVTYRVRVKMKDAAGNWSKWSAPLEFGTTSPDVSAYQQNLVVSEVMYKPVGGSDFEFIELRNLSSSTPLDLSPVTISGGVDYSFPVGTILAPGAYLIIPKKRSAFESRYGAGVPTVAEYGPNDSLNNGGDTLTLNYGENVVIRSFTYTNAAPWPVVTNEGYSIVLRLPPGTTTAPDHNVGANWRLSIALNGNPGTTDAESFAGNPGDDLDSDGLSALLEYALGTSDTNNAQGHSALFLAPASGAFDFTYQRRVAAEDITYSIETSTNLALPWLPAVGTVIVDSQTGPLRTITTRLVPPIGTRAFFVRLKVQK